MQRFLKLIVHHSSDSRWFFGFLHQRLRYCERKCKHDCQLRLSVNRNLGRIQCNSFLKHSMMNCCHQWLFLLSPTLCLLSLTLCLLSPTLCLFPSEWKFLKFSISFQSEKPNLHFSKHLKIDLETMELDSERRHDQLWNLEITHKWKSLLTVSEPSTIASLTSIKASPGDCIDVDSRVTGTLNVWHQKEDQPLYSADNMLTLMKQSFVNNSCWILLYSSQTTTSKTT